MCMEYNEQPVCPNCKHTQRDEDQKKLLQNRLRRIEGQVRGLQSMLEQDAYCNDILIQSAAVSAALSAFNRELLENHIRNCVDCEPCGAMIPMRPWNCGDWIPL